MAETAQRGAAHTRPHSSRARDPLLKAKITVPELPTWLVSRPRIEKRLVEGIQGPLTVVTGPPGAGKTMAIASWAAGSGCGPVAWVTLDEYDNRPRTFWSYIVAALRQVGVPVPGAASALAHGAAMGHVFLLRLASALARNDPPVTLVLDDLHLVTERACLEGLTYVLRNARPGLRLLVASRHDPLLPLHQYRLTGGLTEIRGRDLAFDAAEAAMLMAQHGVKLSQQSLEFITRRSEGWAAGLRMAAISMEGHPDPERFAKNFVADDTAIAGYLVEEVLNTQPRSVRDLLLCTSILDRVNADLADELMGDERASGILPALVERNAFIESAGQGWYRQYSVLRDVLRLKLCREQPRRVTELHRRAACWYQRNGYLGLAVHHAREAHDAHLAARIVVDEFAVHELIEPQGGDELLAAVRTSEGPAQPPLLITAAAAALRDGQDQAAEASLAEADQMLQRLSPGQEAPARFAAAMLRLTLACRRGDFGTASAAAARMKDLTESLPAIQRSRHPEAHVHVLHGASVVTFWTGDLKAAGSLLDRAASIRHTAEQIRPGASPERAACGGYPALAEALRGRLTHAAELATAVGAVPGGAAEGVSPAAVIALALVHLERNELNGAFGRLQAAEAALRAQPDRLLTAIACLVAARADVAAGRPGAAVEALARARTGWDPPPWLDHLLTVAESQAYATAGDPAAALGKANDANPESSLDAAVAAARALLATGDLTGANRALGETARIPPGASPGRVRLDAWLADALLRFRAGEEPQGCRSLERALRLAEPERLRLPFAMERAWLRPVLRRHPELSHTHRVVLEPVLAGMDLTPPPASHPSPVIVEEISAREREVLRRVAEMLSTAEIAAEMYISVNTVKTHLKSSFRKLGVTDRREAIRRAKKLGLL